MYSYEEAFNASKEYFKGDELAANVFINKYALRNNNDELLERTPDDMHKRIAKEFARIEKKKFKKPLSEDFIYELIKGFKYIVPQGSPMYGIGNTYREISLSNCIHGETLVYTKELGLIRMKDIKPGINVLTHKGRFRKVLKHWSNGIKSTLTVCRNFGSKRPSVRDEQEMSRFCSLTPDHRVLDTNGNWVEIKDFYRTFNNKNLKEPTIEYKENIPSFLPLDKGRQLELTNDLMWIFGLYLAEGSIKKMDSNHPSTYFTLNSNEGDFAERIKTFAVEHLGQEPWIQTWENYNFIQVNIFDKAFTLLLDSVFGHGFKNKRIPEWIFGLDKDMINSLLDGFMAGDGTNYENISDDSNTFCLANPTLVYEIGMLTRKIGKHARFNFLCKGKLIKNRTAQCSFYNKEGQVSLITSPLDVEVFDMEVEEDHSFVAGDLICHNCFVVDSPKDNYSSILDVDKQIVNISKRRGGVGVNLDNLRPSGTKVNNAARTSTGITSWMERYSNSIREVGQNGRRGALMETISIRHPDSVKLLDGEPKNITLNANMEHLGVSQLDTTTEYHDPKNLDFCSIKLDRTKVTGANVSIKLDNEFMDCVINNKKYTQSWPLNGEPQISKEIDAKKAWNKIIYSAWASAEPGLLFWENVINHGVADIYEKYRSEAVNPCAELTLCSLDSCRLLLLNLFSFVENAFSKDAYFNFEKFYEYAQYAQRLMDDLVDLESECIEKILKKIKKQFNDGAVELKDEIKMWEKVLDLNNNGRRTGTGITALGDCLAALGVKYGSEQSISITETIYEHLKMGCYRSSVDMARELGTFDCWNPELEKGHPFIERIKGSKLTIVDGNKLYSDMMKYGRRNVSLLTTAPTGSVSILTQTTGGIEPLFMLGYQRKKKINPNDEGVKVDSRDQNGDCWQHFMVYPEKIKDWMRVTGETDVTKSPWYGSCSGDIDWINRVKLQAAAQKHVCHGISSTINLPADVSKEKVAEIYIEAWKAGLKGITIYRDGCRTGVLTSGKEKKININDAIKRPKQLECDIYYYNNMGVIVGKLDNCPYEVFFINDFKPTKQQKIGTITKIKQKHYRLSSNEEVILENAEEHCSKEQEAMARLTSLSLRHNVNLDFIIKQLETVKGDMWDSCRALCKALRHYAKDKEEIKGDSCPECKNKVIRQEGCKKCTSCTWSACG